ncbi:TetR family transcriptional regulator [Curtobacterium sp. PhB172]|uniref:TetR/AcrR family transcriptional regulator n=1 Tax=Curtobacterium sp. PhB172 TaxID=2485196 RepID=UPI000F4D0ED0|nr:TetR/AcrR family transcriptional regulator [Curtobacterium sp. PhB172]ROS67030.1 TetR family transcriptional regulator [Curtobacterium sp. PhB172]
MSPRVSDDTAAPARPTRRRSSTRAELVRAAEALFDETGSASASVEAIVTRAGFTRGAFYSNFATTDELFFAVYEAQEAVVVERLEDGFRAALGTTDPQSADAIVSGVLGGLPPEGKWYAIRSVLLSRARHEPELRALLRAHTDAFHAALEPLLVESVTAQGRRLTVAPDVFTRAVVAAHVGAVSQTVLYDDAATIRVAAVRGALLGLSEPAREPDGADDLDDTGGTA